MIDFNTLLAITVLLIQPADLITQVVQRAAELAYSPPIYPSPWMDPAADGWVEAYIKAKDFVSQMTLVEKVNLTTGVG